MMIESIAVRVADTDRVQRSGFAGGLSWLFLNCFEMAAIVHVQDEGTDADEAAETVAARASAADVQRELIQQNLGAHSGCGRASRVVAAASSPLLEPAVWNAPESAARARGLYERAFPLRPRLLRRRVVVDALATPAETAYFARDALDRFGDPMFGAEEDTAEDAEDSERGVAWVDWAAHPLNARVRGSICDAVRLHFCEARPLYLADAMLTRKTAACGFSPPHVDQANIGCYDYSAVLYLSTQGEDFTDGAFHFLDAEGDEVVEPRAGRCVLFTSGAEHLHQVQHVTSGVRLAMGMWFTLDRGRAHAEAAEGEPPGEGESLTPERTRREGAPGRARRH